MAPWISAPHFSRRTFTTACTCSLVLPLLLFVSVASTSCHQEVGSGIPLPTLIPTAGPASPTPGPAVPAPTHAPTSAPISAATPQPTAFGAKATAGATVVPPEVAPAIYPAIEPDNAIMIRQVAEVPLSGALRLVWSILGDSLAVESQSGLSVFDAGSFSLIHSLTVPTPSKILDLSPDGSTLATLGSQNQVELTDLNSGSLLRTLHPGAQFTEGIFSPDGSTFAIAPLKEIAVIMWDVFTGQQTRKLTGFKTSAPVYSFTFGPYGRSLIWRARVTVQVQDISTGQLGPAFHHEYVVSTAALAPGGRILATAVPSSSGDRSIGTIKLWDAASGKELDTLVQNNGIARSVAFSPDGRLLAATSGNTIELWDVDRREMATTLLGHTESVALVAFSPDGTALASASDGGTVRLWRLPPIK